MAAADNGRELKMPLRLLVAVILLILESLPHASAISTKAFMRQVAGFSIADITEDRLYKLTTGKTQCPKSVKFGPLTPWLESGGLVSFSDIEHDGKQCQLSGDSQDPTKFMIVAPSDLVNDPNKGIQVSFNMLRKPVEQLTDKLSKGKARYYVGFDRSDRICSGSPIQLKGTLTFFVRTDNDLKLPKVQDPLTPNKQYMLVLQPDDAAPSCTYATDLPRSPSPSPSQQSGEYSTSSSGNSSSGNEPNQKPEGSDSNSSSMGTASVGSNDEQDGKKQDGKRQNGKDPGATLSSGAIAGIAVAVTFIAIAVAAAAFVSYRIYHGQRVPIIPERLLPGPLYQDDSSSRSYE